MGPRGAKHNAGARTPIISAAVFVVSLETGRDPGRAHERQIESARAAQIAGGWTTQPLLNDINAQATPLPPPRARPPLSLLPLSPDATSPAAAAADAPDQKKKTPPHLPPVPFLQRTKNNNANTGNQKKTAKAIIRQKDASRCSGVPLVTDCMMGLAVTVAPDCSASLQPALPVASDGTYCEPSVVAQRGSAVMGRYNHGNNLAISIAPVAGGGSAGAFAVGVEGSFAKGNQGGQEMTVRCVMAYALAEGSLLGATASGGAGGGVGGSSGSSMIPLPGQAAVAVQQQQQEAAARAAAAAQAAEKEAALAAAAAPKSLSSGAGAAGRKLWSAGVASVALIAGAVAMA